MKILMINSVCGIRSTGRICSDLATVLEAEGHTVKIGFGRETVPEPLQAYAVRIGSEKDVLLHGVKARLMDADGQGSASATLRFLDWVKNYDPDVIHLHNLHGYYLNVPLLFRYLIESKKKVIWTLHDMWAITGHGCTCEGFGCDRWKTGCGHCPASRHYPSSFMDRSAQNYQKKMAMFPAVEDLTIITPSRWLSNHVRESFLRDKRIVVIPNGINLDAFHHRDTAIRERLGLQEKTIVLGCSSLWYKDKGLFDFYKLADLLHDRFQIILVGLNKNQIKSLPKGIIGIERTNSVDELAEYYSAADVFFNPTYIDNFPTVNLESLACGTPVFTYDTGGSAECLDGQNGKAFSTGDVEGVAAFLQHKFTKSAFHIENTAELSKTTTCARYLKEYAKRI